MVIIVVHKTLNIYFQVFLFKLRVVMSCLVFEKKQCKVETSKWRQRQKHYQIASRPFFFILQPWLVWMEFDWPGQEFVFYLCRRKRRFRPEGREWRARSAGSGRPTGQGWRSWTTRWAHLYLARDLAPINSPVLTQISFEVTCCHKCCQTQSYHAG